ncbi:MAG: very short patch repair endonuclease [Christensenellaceae bacterium]|jgi:DNA mismatch endonuclease (patch repair protein)|nr:very short patch repair endonuclease [Christensenellaceae bacterium]
MKKTPEQISKNMRMVKNKDSEIELLLRTELRKRNIRYRKNATDVTGKPDIVFKGKKIAVFCDSEFWHGYDWENKKLEIKSNQDFWIPKIERTIQRDQEVNDLLKKDGWTVIRFWGYEIKKNVASCVDKIEAAFKEVENDL